MDTRTEYLEQFITLTCGLFVEGIKSIYVISKHNAKDVKYILRDFQKNLSNIPNWSQSIIDQEYDRFTQGTRCEWLGDLVRVLFKTRVQKMIEEIQIQTNCNDVQPLEVIIPTPPSFIHECYIEIARNVYKKPYLLYDGVLKLEYTRNMSDVEDIVRKSISSVVRSKLPYKELLRLYMNTGGDRDVNAKRKQPEEEDIIVDAAEEEDTVTDAAEEEDTVLNAAEEEDTVLNAAEEEDIIVDAAEEEDIIVDAAEEKDIIVDAAEEEDTVIDAAEEEDTVLNAAEEEDIIVDAAEEEDIIVDAAEEEDTVVNAAEEEDIIVDAVVKTEQDVVEDAVKDNDFDNSSSKQTDVLIIDSDDDTVVDANRKDVFITNEDIILPVKGQRLSNELRKIVYINPPKQVLTSEHLQSTKERVMSMLRR